jgi:secondary thiamine-phosphate synthase enzyme
MHAVDLQREADVGHRASVVVEQRTVHVRPEGVRDKPRPGGRHGAAAICRCAAAVDGRPPDRYKRCVPVVDVVFRESFTLTTPGRGMNDITRRVAELIQRAGVHEGLATVFVHHTSASLVLQENASPEVPVDLETFLGALVPDGDRRYRHVDEGPDDMSAHVRSALTSTSVGIPVAAGRLDLGRWQGIWLWEHRTTPHERRVSVVVVGAR